MNLLRPSPLPDNEQTVFEKLPEEGYGMEWDIIYDEEIRMSEQNDQNPYIFIPYSEEMESGDGFEAEGSGDNGDFEGYDGDGELQFEAKGDLLENSGDGLILEEGSGEVTLGQRRMDYSDYESPNNVQDLSELLEEDYIDQQQELEPVSTEHVEEEAKGFEMMEMEEGEKRKLVNDELYQTQFGESALPIEIGENEEEDLNQIVENLDTIDDMDLDTIENLDTIESMLTSILGNINLVSQQQYDVQYQTQFDLSERADLGEETEDTMANPTSSINTNNVEEQEELVDVQQQLHMIPPPVTPDETDLEKEIELLSEPEPGAEPEAEPEPWAEPEQDFDEEDNRDIHTIAEPEPQQKDNLMSANLQREEYEPEAESDSWPDLQQRHDDDPQQRAQEEVQLEAHLKQTSKLEIEDGQEGKPQHVLTLGNRPHLQEHTTGTESSEVIVNDLNYINNGPLGGSQPHNGGAVGKEAAVGEIGAKTGGERENNVQMLAIIGNGVDREGKEVNMKRDGDDHLQGEPVQLKQDNPEGHLNKKDGKYSDNTEQQSISELVGPEKTTVVSYGANKKPRLAGNEAMAMVRDAAKDPAKDGGNKAAKEATIANTLGIRDKTSDKAPQKMAMIDERVNRYQSTDVNFEAEKKDSMFFLPAGHGLFFGFKLGEMEKADKMRLEIFANNQIHTDIDSSTIELAL